MADIYSRQVRDGQSPAPNLSFSTSPSNTTLAPAFSNALSNDSSSEAIETLRTPPFNTPYDRLSLKKKVTSAFLQLGACLILLLYLGVALYYLSPSPASGESNLGGYSLESEWQPELPLANAAASLSSLAAVPSKMEASSVERPSSSSAVTEKPIRAAKKAIVKTARMKTPAQKTFISTELSKIQSPPSSIELPQPKHAAPIGSEVPDAPKFATTTTTELALIPTKKSVVVKWKKEKEIVARVVDREENKPLKNSRLEKEGSSEVVEEKTSTLASAPLLEEEVEEVTETASIARGVEDLKIEGLETIRQQAALEGKPFFLKFGAKWCLPCKMMEKSTFQDEKLKAYVAEYYLSLNIDVDDFDGFNLKQLYQVNVLPSILIFDAKGDLLARYEESMSASTLLGHLEAHHTEQVIVEDVEEDLVVDAQVEKSLTQLEGVLLQRRLK